MLVDGIQFTNELVFPSGSGVEVGDVVKAGAAIMVPFWS